MQDDRHLFDQLINMLPYFFVFVVIRNMMGSVDRISVFFHSHPKRQKSLDHTIDRSTTVTKKSKIKDLCRTRWVQRVEALETFSELRGAVIDCLEMICEEGPKAWSTDSLTE